MRSTSAATTVGCPCKSGFDAIEALSPTEVPPFTMIIAMRSSVIELCHFGLRKFAGFGFRLEAAGPSPPPSTPWHTAQRSANIESAAARASGVMEFDLDRVGELCGQPALAVRATATVTSVERSARLIRSMMRLQRTSFPAAADAIRHLRTRQGCEDGDRFLDPVLPSVLCRLIQSVE